MVKTYEGAEGRAIREALAEGAEIVTEFAPGHTVWLAKVAALLGVAVAQTEPTIAEVRAELSRRGIDVAPAVAKVREAVARQRASDHNENLALCPNKRDTGGSFWCGCRALSLPAVRAALVSADRAYEPGDDPDQPDSDREKLSLTIGQIRALRSALFALDAAVASLPAVGASTTGGTATPDVPFGAFGTLPA